MSSIKYCETCGKEIITIFGSGRFCSRSCANTRIATDESKAKAREKAKEAIQRYYDKGCECEKCGAVFHTKDYSRKLCFNCLPTTIKHTKGKECPESILDVSKRTISKILRRMDLPCSCCGFHISGIILDIHHIIPKSKGGQDSMDNLTYICPNCHRIAHTDISLLQKPLISIQQQLSECGKNWKDFYYG